MYRHILISTDGSDVAAKGLHQGLDLAAALGATVTIVTVTERFPVFAGAVGDAWVAGPAEIEAFEARQKELADDVLKTARAAAAQAGVAAETVHVPGALPAEAIVETAKARGCDLIAMSSHGRRGLGRLLLGSQTSEVLSNSPVTVLVIR